MMSCWSAFAKHGSNKVRIYPKDEKHPHLMNMSYLTSALINKRGLSPSVRMHMCLSPAQWADKRGLSLLVHHLIDTLLIILSLPFEFVRGNFALLRPVYL